MSTYYLEVAVNQNTNTIEVNPGTSPSVEVKLENNLHNIDVVDETIAITNTNKPLGSVPYSETSQVAGDYEVSVFEDVVMIIDSEVGTLSNTINITLHTAFDNLGKIIRIKNRTTKTVNIKTKNNETIDDLTSYDLLYKNESVTLLSDGNNWCIV